MATFHDLKDCLTEVLEGQGTLGKLRAQVQREIFQVLNEGDSTSAAGHSRIKPPSATSIPPINLLINELFREYLQFNQYHHTLAVFLNESGHPEQPAFERKFIAEELKISDVSTTKKNLNSRLTI